MSSTQYVGKRRAAPVSGQSFEEPAATTPAYVGKRCARAPHVSSPTVTPTATTGSTATATLPSAAAPALVKAGSAPRAGLDDSTIDLPRISVAAQYAAGRTDEVVPPIRSQQQIRRRVRRGRRISLPAVAGAAALIIAAGGTAASVADRGDDTSDASRGTTASALTGSSAVDSAESSSTRTAQTSRSGGGRSVEDANIRAAKRAEALDQLDAQASGQDKLLEQNRWGLPVTPGVYHLTATFGEYGLWSSSHTGLDFAADTGTPIHAVARGTVTSAGYDGAYGNKTVVTLEDGTELWYCHQNEFGVSVGDTVETGDLIGYVGSTGHVTGPHLHLEVRPGGGDPVDPYAALVEHGLQP